LAKIKVVKQLEPIILGAETGNLFLASAKITRKLRPSNFDNVFNNLIKLLGAF